MASHILQQVVTRQCRQAVRAVAPFLLIGGGAVGSENTTACDYWEHDKKDFDLYIDKPKGKDLPVLLREFQNGKEVWPWIWCQPNENGPHHVFACALTPQILSEIRELLKNPNNNVLIITTPEQLAKVPPKLVEMCGLVTDANVEIINMSDRILMLDDERVIAFDQIRIISD